MRSDLHDDIPETPTCLYCHAPTDTEICAACAQAIRETSATVLEERTAPMRTATPLPEAAFSITLKGRLGGQEALLTARGQTWEAFRANVEQIRGLLDAPAAPPTSQPRPRAAAPTQPPPEGWCAVHHVPMKLQTKDGRQWYSHKMADGWCKGK